jgi:oligoendopeptidase F
LLISKYLQKRIREDPDFVKKFKEFLKAGSSKSVQDIFMDLDVDISQKDFWKEGVENLKSLTSV